jgi:hypothetical protein
VDDDLKHIDKEEERRSTTVLQPNMFSTTTTTKQSKISFFGSIFSISFPPED